MVRGDDVGLPKRGLLECLCSHSSSRSSLAASAPHLHSLQGFGIYFSYFLTVASWVRFIISWTGRKKPHGAGVMEGEHAPAELAFIRASACLRSPTAPGRPEVSRDTWAGAAQQGASAGSQATWLTLSMSSKGAGRLLGPAGGLPCSRDPRHWLRHWGNQFTRKLTRMRRWVGLLFAPSHRPSGQSWPGSAWGIGSPSPSWSEGRWSRRDWTHSPYTSLQASVLSPRKGTDICLVLPVPGSSPSSPLYG